MDDEELIKYQSGLTYMNLEDVHSVKAFYFKIPNITCTRVSQKQLRVATLAHQFLTKKKCCK